MIATIALGALLALSDSGRAVPDSVATERDAGASPTESALGDVVVSDSAFANPDTIPAGDHPDAGRPIARRVVVKGRRMPGTSGQRRSVLEGDALAARRGEDLARTLSDLPGMGTLGTGGVAKPVLDGMHSQRLPVIVDGIRLEGQSWGGEHAPEVDPFLAERLVVVRGAAGVRHGAGALGGAIVAEPAPLPRSPGLHGEAVGTAASNGPVLGAAAKVSGGLSVPAGVGWRLQGGARKGGDLRAPDVVLPNTALEEASGAGALGWHRDGWGIEAATTWYDLDQGLLSSAHIGNLSDLRYALERGAPPESSSWSFDPRRPEQRVEHRTNSLRVAAPIATGWSVGGQASRQTDRRREWDAHRAIDADLAALDAPQIDYELRSDAVEASIEHGGMPWRGSVGIALDRQENEYSGRAFVPNYRAKGIGGWVSLERTWGIATFDAGARWDRRTLGLWWRSAGEIRSSSSEWDGVSAGAGTSLRIADGWTVRSHVGSAWRPPSAVELRADGLHHGTASIEKGDSSLGPERSWTGQISTDVSRDRWNASASAWATRVDDYIALRPAGEPVLTVRGAFPAFRYGAVDALLWGGDAAVSIRPREWLEARLRGDLLFTRDGAGQPLPFAPVHKVVAAIQGLRARLGVLRSLAAGPRLEWFAEADPIDGDYAPPPPSTWLLGFDAAARIGEEQGWLFSLSGRNLTNRTWRDPTDRLRYFAPRPGAGVDAKVAFSW